MSLDGDFDSWDERIDHCLGQATALLEMATQAFMSKSLSCDDAANTSALVESWRELAESWQERQAHELELSRAVECEYEEEYEECEAEEVTAS